MRQLSNHAANTRREGGQTIVLVAVYGGPPGHGCSSHRFDDPVRGARRQIQRAADAAALAGAKATIATGDPNTNPGGQNGAAQQGLQCLIHTTATGPPGSNPEQDTLDASVANNGLLPIQPGSYSQSRYHVAPESVMATSDSIVTVPLFDVPNTWPPPGQQVTIVGFLQFVRELRPPPREEGQDSRPI